VSRANTGPYAPRREPVQVDWAGMHAALDADRRLRAAEDAAARAAVRQDPGTGDPLAQLVAQAHAADQRIAALEQRFDVFEQQLAAIIAHLNGGNGHA
jgi:hypothetical protein